MNLFRSAPSVPMPIYNGLLSAGVGRAADDLTGRFWHILQSRLRSLFSSGRRESDLRAARRTAFVDDTVRDILYALRGFKRAPLVAFTIVSTVALGLGLVAAVFTVLNALVFRVDAVPAVQEMFAVERPLAVGEPAGLTRAEFDALRRGTDFCSAVYAQVADVDSRVDGRLMYGTFVTGNFFQVLRVSAAMGRPLTPADDEPSAEQPVMVLSH